MESRIGAVAKVDIPMYYCQITDCSTRVPNSERVQCMMRQDIFPHVGRVAPRRATWTCVFRRHVLVIIRVGYLVNKHT